MTIPFDYAIDDFDLAAIKTRLVPINERRARLNRLPITIYPDPDAPKFAIGDAILYHLDRQRWEALVYGDRPENEGALRFAWAETMEKPFEEWLADAREQIASRFDDLSFDERAWKRGGDYFVDPVSA